MAPTLAELLKEPFGPYWHDDILDPNKCKSTPSKVLTLREVMFSCGDMPIGLTQTEVSQPECDNERLAGGAVFVRGILEIESYYWLTEYGRSDLQDKVRCRDMAYRIREGGTGQPGGITLEGLYNVHGSGQGRGHSSRRIKVWIQGVKRKPAAYMTADLVPGGLKIDLENQDNSHRSFHVTNMHVETYALSRLFLARYRLVRDMRDILRSYKEDHDGEDVPVATLTPEWYVEQYLNYKATMPSFRERRIIYDSEDEDIEPDTGGMLKQGKNRKLRHVSTAEVRSLLAMHARWIINDQQRVLHVNKRLIHVDTWVNWLREVRRWREQARRENADMAFGVFDRDGSEISDDASDDDDIEMSEELSEQMEEEVQMEVRPKPKAGRKRMAVLEVVVPRKRRRGPTTGRNARPRVESPPTSSSPSPAPTPISHSIGQQATSKPSSHLDDPADDYSDDERSYDTDITDSEASTPPWSGSDDDSLPSRPQTPLSPTLIARIPPQLRRCPELPAYGFTWYCPVAQCKYEINLLHLTTEQSALLEDDAAALMNTTGWSLSDERVQEVFLDLVELHYFDHLNAEGVELLGDDNDRGVAKLRWKIPEAHPTSRLRESPVVKEEQ